MPQSAIVGHGPKIRVEKKFHNGLADVMQDIAQTGFWPTTLFRHQVHLPTCTGTEWKLMDMS